MSRSELFDPVLHSSLDDLAFVTKQRLVQGGVVRREVLSKLQNTELIKLSDWCSHILIFDPHVQRSVALLSVFNYLWMPQFTNLADFI